MKTVFEHIRQHLLERCGIYEGSERVPDLDQLRESEWSKDFESLMRNRLIMGRFRYGKLGQSKGLNRVKSIQKRLGMYADTGNAEHLVDISNIAMMEYVEQNHPDYHWSSQDDAYHDEMEWPA